jgi:hypothetical protein
VAYKSYEEKALEYETAISAIVTGQLSSYSIAGRSFTKHDLATLEKLYQYYRSKANEELRGFITLGDMRCGE